MVTLWQRQYNEDGTHELVKPHASEVDLFDPNKKTILALPGNSAISEKVVKPNDDSEMDIYQRNLFGYENNNVQANNVEGQISGILKRAEFLLYGQKGQREDVQILAASYLDALDNSISSEHIKSLNNDPANYYSKNRGAMALVEQAFLPAFAEKKESGAFKRRDIEDVKKAFSNITTFGNSYGTTFDRELDNAITKSMRYLNYKEDEIKEALAQKVSIRIADVNASTPRDLPQSTGVDVASISDKVATKTKQFKEEIPEDFKGVLVKKTAKNRIRLWVDTPEQATIRLTDKGVERDVFDKQAHDVLLFAARRVQGDMSQEAFTEFNKKYVQMRDTLEATMRNAVNREGDIAVGDLFKPAEPLSPDVQGNQPAEPNEAIAGKTAIHKMLNEMVSELSQNKQKGGR